MNKADYVKPIVEFQHFRLTQEQLVTTSNSLNDDDEYDPFN